MNRIELTNIKKIHDVPNLDMFSTTIYNNFIQLSNNQDLNHTTIEIKRILQSNNMHGFKLILDGKIIGYILNEINVIPDGRMVMYVHYVYIALKYRNNGFGKILVKKTLDKSKHLGISFVMLVCNGQDNKVLSFYKQFGFDIDTIQKQKEPYIVLVKYNDLMTI